MAIQLNQLADIKSAISSGNKPLARELLRTEIKQNPTADTWFLASFVATSQEQSIGFLKKAIENDPFHEQAAAKLKKLQAKRGSSLISKVSVNSNLMSDTVALFVQNDWDLKIQTQNMAQLEKRKGVSKLASFLVIFFFGLIGMLIVLAGIATAKMEKINLQLQPDGRIRATGTKISGVVDDANQLTNVAMSVKEGVTYAGVIGFGILMTIIWIVIF